MHFVYVLNLQENYVSLKYSVMFRLLSMLLFFSAAVMER